MTPQFVDLNGDGSNDIVTATFMGEVYIAKGSAEGFSTPENLVDRDGDNIRIGMYYDNEKNDYATVDRSAEGAPASEDHLTSVAVVDWDGDGDMDLLLGGHDEGGLYVCLNEGSKNEPKFATTHFRVRTNGKPIELEGGLMTPRVCDWNGDGRFDILCGLSKGAVHYFENIGEKGKPKFGKRQILVDVAANYLTGETEVVGEEEMGFAFMPVPDVDGEPVCPAESFHIETTDYDGDGDLDLLIGASSYCTTEEKELTKEEEKEKQDIEKKMATLGEKMGEFFNDIDEQEETDEQDAMEAIYELPEFQEINDELMALYERMEELAPSPNSIDRVWLFRNKSQSSGNIESTRSVANKKSNNNKNDVSVSASINPANGKAGDTTRLTIEVSVPKGFHIYGSKNEKFPTTIEITNSGSLTLETIAAPAGNLHADAGVKSYWLEGSFKIEQEVTLPDDFESTTIEGQVDYMMCDENTCRRPTKKSFSASISKKQLP